MNFPKKDSYINIQYKKWAAHLPKTQESRTYLRNTINEYPNSNPANASITNKSPTKRQQKI